MLTQTITLTVALTMYTPNANLTLTLILNPNPNHNILTYCILGQCSDSTVDCPLTNNLTLTLNITSPNYIVEYDIKTPGNTHEIGVQAVAINRTCKPFLSDVFAQLRCIGYVAKSITTSIHRNKMPVSGDENCSTPRYLVCVFLTSHSDERSVTCALQARFKLYKDPTSAIPNVT